MLGKPLDVVLDMNMTEYVFWRAYLSIEKERMDAEIAKAKNKAR